MKAHCVGPDCIEVPNQILYGETGCWCHLVKLFHYCHDGAAFSLRPTRDDECLTREGLYEVHVNEWSPFPKSEMREEYRHCFQFTAQAEERISGKKREGKRKKKWSQPTELPPKVACNPPKNVLGSSSECAKMNCGSRLSFRRISQIFQPEPSLTLLGQSYIILCYSVAGLFKLCNCKITNLITQKVMTYIEIHSAKIQSFGERFSQGISKAKQISLKHCFSTSSWINKAYVYSEKLWGHDVTAF